MQTVKQEYPEVRCMLVGPYDSNPSALQPEELEEYINQGIVEYYGEQQDVRPFLKQCSILCYHLIMKVYQKLFLKQWQ